jgi:phosphohistidine phosphatase SixA
LCVSRSINSIKSKKSGMKKLILFLTVITYILSSCSKVEDPQGFIKLSVSGSTETVIVNYNTTIQYSAYPVGLFSLNKPEAGVVDVFGKFKSGTAEGVYTLTVVNAKDILDTVRRTIIVTKHADIFNNMKLTGNYLLSFRHADATNGADQTTNTSVDWWKSSDPAKARQITNPIGYKQSDSTGSVMRMLSLPFDTTMTSEFNRCKQTAEYFKLGVPNKEYADLTYYVYDEPSRYANTMSLYAKKAMTTKNYLAVTHAGFSITPAVAPLNTLAWGDCAVFKLNPGGAQPTYMETIPLTDWLALARK